MDVLEISAERHKVTLSLEGSHCELMGSASELSELVYNLIDNAIRYNRPGGSVRVKIDIDPVGCPSGARRGPQRLGHRNRHREGAHRARLRALLPR